MSRSVFGGSVCGYLPILNDLAAWVAAVVNNGGTVSGGRQVIVGNLITGLRADGIWLKLDRLWLFAAENTPSALTDLVGLTLATANGSPTFVIDQGYTGVNASTTIYINTNYNAFTAGGNWTQDFAHMSTWSATNITAAGTAGYLMGNYHVATDVFNHIIPRYSDGNAYLGINELNTGDAGVAVVNAVGHYCTSRVSSLTSNEYKNAVSIYDTGLASNAAINNLDIYVLAVNNDGAIQAGAGNQCAMTSLGGGLTSTEVTSFYNRLLTYMIAVGVADTDASVTAWMAQVRTNGGSVSIARRNVVHNLVTSLKADGIWTKLDRLWLFAAENEGSALTDLVGLTLATAVGSPTFTIDTGYNGNGSSSYINTNYNPTTDAINFALDAACAFGWQLESGSDNGVLLGGNDAVNDGRGPYLWPRYTDDNNYWGLNHGLVGDFIANSDGSGFWHMVRSASTVSTLYQNGVSFDTDTTVSTAVANTDLNVLFDSPVYYSSKTCPCAGYGGVLDATEAGNFYTHIRTYMTAVGVP